MRIALAVFLRIILASSAFAADFTGPVVSVLDGDTIEVLHNGRAKRVRLSGIDGPEKGQAYGARARQAASELIGGKDKDGRTRVDILPLAGMKVTHMLVKDGS